jgi:F-type H+-transporting ATPase subunit delta
MPRRSLPSAKRYARAVFEIGQAAGTLGQWSEELAIMALAGANAEFVALLEAPGITSAEKAEAVLGVLPDLSEGGRNMLSLIISRRAASLLPRIRERFQELIDDEEGIRRVEAATAVAMTDSERAYVIGELSKTLAGEIRLSEMVDPTLLGGMRIRVGDRVMDGSVKGRLASLRQSVAAGAMD